MAEEMQALAAEANHRPGCGPLATLSDRPATSLTQQVFERIRATGRIPRSDVAKDLGVSPGSVTAAVTQLMEAGLVCEAPKPNRDAARGRPPVDLTVVSGAHYVCGITLRDRLHIAVITDTCGNVLADAELPCGWGGKSVETILAEIDAVMARVLAAAGLALTDLVAVGIGLPGFVDNADGRVHWSPILRDRQVPLVARLNERLPCEIHIDNDVNLLALAESWFGKGRELSDFAVVTIEHGVGMGVILNNRLYRGALGMGLEIGHTTVQLDGALCRCGQRGCLEAYVADYALVREAYTALEWDSSVPRTPEQTLEVLFDQAKAGNEAARLIFRRAGRYLSTGLANVIRIFDPQLLIISGARLRYDYLYAEEVLAEMHRFTDHIGRPRTNIAIHSWGDTVWARGAAALALSAVTDRLSAQG